MIEVVIPAKAGIQSTKARLIGRNWAPAFAGVTESRDPFRDDPRIFCELVSPLPHSPLT